MLNERMFSGSQVSEWFTNSTKSILIPSRGGPGNGWVQYINDPLTSLTNVSPGLQGSWGINEYLQGTSGTSTQLRLVHNNITPTSPASGYIASVEFEIPTNFSSTNDHVGLGFQNGAIDQTGRWVGIIRGDSQIGFLRDTLGWASLTGYVKPVAGTWVLLSVVYVPGTGTTVYLNGAQLATTANSSAFTVGNTRVMLMWFNDNSGQTVRFRNLRAWYQANNSIDYQNMPLI